MRGWGYISKIPLAFYWNEVNLGTSINKQDCMSLDSDKQEVLLQSKKTGKTFWLELNRNGQNNRVKKKEERK